MPQAMVSTTSRRWRRGRASQGDQPNHRRQTNQAEATQVRRLIAGPSRQADGDVPLCSMGCRLAMSRLRIRQDARVGIHAGRIRSEDYAAVAVGTGGEII